MYHECVGSTTQYYIDVQHALFCLICSVFIWTDLFFKDNYFKYEHIQYSCLQTRMVISRFSIRQNNVTAAIELFEENIGVCNICFLKTIIQSCKTSLDKMQYDVI